MTGLDVQKEVIMEAAVIVTDSDLNVVAKGPNLILNVDSDKLDNMNDWCKKQHGQVCIYRFYIILPNIPNIT